MRLRHCSTTPNPVIAARQTTVRIQPLGQSNVQAFDLVFVACVRLPCWWTYPTPTQFRDPPRNKCPSSALHPSPSRPHCACPVKYRQGLYSDPQSHATVARAWPRPLCPGRSKHTTAISIQHLLATHPRRAVAAVAVRLCSSLPDSSPSHSAKAAAIEHLQLPPPSITDRQHHFLIQAACEATTSTSTLHASYNEHHRLRLG